MPRLSIHGNAAMGIAGVQGSINRTLIPDSYGPYWMTHKDCVFIQPSTNALVIYDVTTGARTPASGPANDIRAGGGVWATWLAGTGLQASTGLSHADWGLLDVSRDGAIAHNVRQHDIYGVDVTEITGDVWKLTPNLISDLQLLGGKRAIWREGTRIVTYNLPPCTQVPGNLWIPRAADLGGEWWVTYFSELYGQVLHPFASTVGYVICAPGVAAFNPDLVALSGEVVRVAWSATQGEGPNDLLVRDVNIRAEPRTEIAGAPVISIPPINKPCWLGWFEFTDAVTYLPPSNCNLWVKQGGPIKDTAGMQFALWVQGASVAEIESKVQQASWPCVAYWDGRTWPAWPSLRSGDWLALQAYCWSSETPTAFGLNVQAMIHAVPSSYAQIALVCQCYTSNTGLTTALASLVPVYAQLARDNPRVTMLLVFTDQGRGTGLCDHPEVKPYWQELFTTITGTPAIDTGGGGGSTMDWTTIHTYGQRRWAELEVSRKSQELANAGLACRDFQKDCFTRIASELYHEQHIPCELFWKAGLPEYGNPQDVREKLAHIGEDILVDRPANGYKDVVTAMGHPSAAWNASGGLSPVTGGDLNRCGPPPALEAPAPIPPEPPVEGGVVGIQYWDQLVRRSDPDGMLIRFDVYSERPVLTIDLDLEGDGAPSIELRFLNETSRDGRFCRALAFKPTVPGWWVLRVTATDDQGAVYRSDGSHRVEVVD